MSHVLWIYFLSFFQLLNRAECVTFQVHSLDLLLQAVRFYSEFEAYIK